MMTQGQIKESYESVLPITTVSSSTLDTEIKLADLSELKHPVLSFMFFFFFFATHACGKPCITYMQINHVACTCQCLCQERMWQLLALFILLLV